MFGTPSTFVASLARARDERRARRALARELSDYATPAERDDLGALVAGRAAADSEAARILASQTTRELFRVG